MSNKSSTPLVDSLNLPLVHTDAFAIAPGGLYVNIKDLEAALEKLTKVTGAIDGNGNFHVQNHSSYDTHTARLLGIQEIPEEPFIHTEGWAASRSQEHVLIPIELKGKRLKVTFEEVK